MMAGVGAAMTWPHAPRNRELFPDQLDAAVLGSPQLGGVVGHGLRLADPYQRWSSDTRPSFVLRRKPKATLHLRQSRYRRLHFATFWE